MIFSGLILFIFAFSCDKSTLCDDDELTINRIINNSNMLNLSGYYYGDISGINSDHPNIYLINQNGIFINANSFSLSDAETGNVTFTYPDLAYQYKGDWGVYKLENNTIEIEYWVSRSCGGVGLLYEKGIILNDSTFKITYWRRSYGDKTEREEYINAIFRFQKYSPKPDSTIRFIE